MRTLEEVIASYEKSAERYRKAFLHCKAHGGEFYQEEAESNKICYEHDRQLADLLKELKERRETQEIIRCSECAFCRPFLSDKVCSLGLLHNINSNMDFCSRAVRRADEIRTP